MSLIGHDKPVILGGNPILEQPVSIARPTLPEIKEIQESFCQIYNSGMITNSNYVQQFEERVADYLGVKEAVCVSSCTSGLMLVIKALELTGEVIIPSFTFFASGHALLWNNLKPVFVDCVPSTYNINHEIIQKCITSNTSAIMAIHIFGNPVEIESIQRIATDNNLRVIIDSAHAIGTRYKGRLVGSFGDAEVFCLSPTKVLTAIEGGIITTNNQELAKKLRIGRDYGNSGNYDCEFLGLSARMEEFNALVGLKGLEHIEEIIAKRSKLVNIYQENICQIPGISFQQIDTENTSSYKDLGIIIKRDEFGLDRDKLAYCLDIEGIATKKYFYPPLHQQSLYRKYQQSPLIETEYVSNNILCLPLYSHMEEKIVQDICHVVWRIYKYQEEIAQISTCDVMDR
ncbi:DegT/DnrJ/EryC1/StrS family aminotransferase [bacterium]|nr:DegT/DnrJ/EryC1/StrS family aminotransferase [bacterium]MBU1752484.1 DegT/DnrJ/EryC1/StrS family aminotransferase [bacterium]